MTNDIESGTVHSPSREAILLALFENYESIYDVDAQTNSYQCYHESEAFRELRIESKGDDFFDTMGKNLKKTVYPADQDYVRTMLSRNNLLETLKRDKYYSIVYRLVVDGEPRFHKVRAVMEQVDGHPHILLGVRNIDEAVRSDQANQEKLASMYQKEKNHMEAILGTAASYMEANLTRDEVLEFKLQNPSSMEDSIASFFPESKHVSYSELERWRCEKCIADNVEAYARTSKRENLIQSFERGEKRASIMFSMRNKDGSSRLCRKVFYLYRDDASDDILSFCVVYDLTEQQKREMEMEKLEDELRMSRIRNSTSQMQPHFLYNALGSIQEVILDDPAYASKLLGDFTIHLRSCIRAMENDEPIPFAQELDNIRAYVSIEQMRFGKKLKISYRIEADNFCVVPLSIQPLVENAIRHGVYERGPVGGTVTIRSFETKDAWKVLVEDDGVGFDVPAYKRAVASGRRDSTGLKNITFRLDKVMHAQVQIESQVGVGTKVCVTIPKGGEK